MKKSELKALIKEQATNEVETSSNIVGMLADFFNNTLKAEGGGINRKYLTRGGEVFTDKLAQDLVDSLESAGDYQIIKTSKINDLKTASSTTAF